MKAFLLTFAVAAFSLPAFAVQVQMTCYPKAYACYGGPAGVSCQWNVGAAQTSVVTLAQDLSYPNAQYPYDVWRAQYRNFYDNHTLIVNFEYSSNPASTLTMHASLATPSVIAETSGTNTIDIGMHNQNFGRGFFCQADLLNP